MYIYMLFYSIYIYIRIRIYIYIYIMWIYRGFEHINMHFYFACGTFWQASTICTWQRTTTPLTFLIRLTIIKDVLCHYSFCILGLCGSAAYSSLCYYNRLQTRKLQTTRCSTTKLMREILLCRSDAWQTQFNHTSLVCVFSFVWKCVA